MAGRRGVGRGRGGLRSGDVGRSRPGRAVPGRVDIVVQARVELAAGSDELPQERVQPSAEDLNEIMAELM